MFVLLAGGKSERMGFPKGLLAYRNTVWILEQLNRIAQSTVTTVYVGLGYCHQDYFCVIPWLKDAQEKFIRYNNLKIKVVVNREPERGSFSTLQTVLAQIPKKHSVLIHPIDVPILNAIELEEIISTDNCIVLPHYLEKNGHPIKVAPSFWNPIVRMDVNDKNARLDFLIKKKNPKKLTLVAVQDSDIVLNLNTPKDWEYFTQKSEQLS